MSYKGSITYFARKYLSFLGMLAAMLAQALKVRARQEQRRRERLGASTLEWGRRYLPHHFLKRPSQMHVWLGTQLDTLHQDRGTKLNVIGPRGGAKSTIGTLSYVLRAAVEGWEQYIWIISDTKTQAQTHLENIKAELEQNALLSQHFPAGRCKHPGTLGNRITLTNGTVIEAFGTGQRLRGRRMRASRPSLIVCDDLQNDGHMQSVHLRESSRNWFHGTVLKAGDKLTNFINLATALHRDALAMELDRTPGWISAKFQAIEVWPTNMDLWHEWEKIYYDCENPNASEDAHEFFTLHRAELEAGAELLWPDEEDLYTLMKMRVESGHTAFEREKQSSPIDHERCEWPETYFEDQIWFTEWPADLQFKVIALDPSKGKDARHGDYSAFVVLGADRRGIVYVEADLARRPTPQIVADGVALCRRHKAKMFGVEANQFQELLADEFVAEFSRQGIFACVPSAIHNSTNKQMRIRQLGPLLSKRRLRFLKSSPGTQLLVDQLRDFPLGSHDDGPDALEMALRLAAELSNGMSWDDGLGNRLVMG